MDGYCASAEQMIVPSPSAQALLRQDGAVTRGPADHPLPWRRAAWHVARVARWDDPALDDRAVAWARRLTSELRAWTSGDVYLDFIGDEGADRVLAGLEPET